METDHRSLKLMWLGDFLMRLWTKWFLLRMTSSPTIHGFYDITACRPRIVPEPAHLRLYPGFFSVGPETAIRFDGSADGAADAAALLSRITGHALSNASAAPAVHFVPFESDPEGYYVNISEAAATLGANSYRAFVWAIQTFLQLFEAPLKSTFARSAQQCFIEDYPRFPWRALLLDVSHQYFAPPAVAGVIRVMSMHKLNVLQLRLADQFWRLQLRGYPELTAKRAGRYTAADVAAIVAAGRAYGVDVVPEVGLPSHVHGALSVFPELACGGNASVPTRLCVGSGAALAFVEGVLSEVADLFPSRFVSIGGDTALDGRWARCAKCRERMAAENLTTEAELLQFFLERARVLLERRGRTLVTRDPALHPAVVVAAPGEVPGRPAVIAPPDFELAAAQFHNDPFPSAPGLVTLRRVYAFRPPPSALGLQAALWTEFVANEEQLAAKISPRLAAFAEVAWTAEGLRDWRRFSAALAAPHAARLAAAGARPLTLEQYPFAHWTEAEVASDWAQVGWNASAAFPGPGTYVVQFHWTHGAPLELRNVGLTDAGAEWVAIDEHMGVAGTNSFRNVYRLTIEETPGEWLLRAEVRNFGGGQTGGDIYVDFTAE
jgi:hexosaminidase